jgi:hypothetical protein
LFVVEFQDGVVTTRMRGVAACEEEEEELEEQTRLQYLTTFIEDPDKPEELKYWARQGIRAWQSAERFWELIDRVGDLPSGSDVSWRVEVGRKRDQPEPDRPTPEPYTLPVEMPEEREDGRNVVLRGSAYQKASYAGFVNEDSPERVGYWLSAIDLIGLIREGWGVLASDQDEWTHFRTTFGHLAGEASGGDGDPVHDVNAAIKEDRDALLAAFERIVPQEARDLDGTVPGMERWVQNALREANIRAYDAENELEERDALKARPPGDGLPLCKRCGEWETAYGKCRIQRDGLLEQTALAATQPTITREQVEGLERFDPIGGFRMGSSRYGVWLERGAVLALFPKPANNEDHNK